MTVPEDLHYTAEHEWLRIEGDMATVGITAYAALALGDIVFAGLPKIGDTVVAGTPCGEIESTKSASDVYAPASGKVVEVNTSLTDHPDLINSDPYRAGWLFCFRLATPPHGLLGAAEYTALIEET